LGVSPHRLCEAQHCLRKAQPRFVSASGMMLTYGQMMFATALQNDVVSLRTQTQKNKALPKKCFVFLGVLSLMARMKCA